MSDRCLQHAFALHQSLVSTLLRAYQGLFGCFTSLTRDLPSSHRKELGTLRRPGEAGPLCSLPLPDPSRKPLSVSPPLARTSMQVLYERVLRKSYPRDQALPGIGTSMVPAPVSVETVSLATVTCLICSWSAVKVGVVTLEAAQANKMHLLQG